MRYDKLGLLFFDDSKHRTSQHLVKHTIGYLSPGNVKCVEVEGTLCEKIILLVVFNWLLFVSVYGLYHHPSLHPFSRTYLPCFSKLSTESNLLSFFFHQSSLVFGKIFLTIYFNSENTRTVGLVSFYVTSVIHVMCCFPGL